MPATTQPQPTQRTSTRRRGSRITIDGAAYHLPEGVTRFGRGADCELRLDRPDLPAVAGLLICLGSKVRVLKGQEADRKRGRLLRADQPLRFGPLTMALAETAAAPAAPVTEPQAEPSPCAAPQAAPAAASDPAAPAIDRAARCRAGLRRLIERLPTERALPATLAAAAATVLLAWLLFTAPTQPLAPAAARTDGERQALEQRLAEAERRLAAARNDATRALGAAAELGQRLTDARVVQDALSAQLALQPRPDLQALRDREALLAVQWDLLAAAEAQAKPAPTPLPAPALVARPLGTPQALGGGNDPGVGPADSGGAPVSKPIGASPTPSKPAATPMASFEPELSKAQLEQAFAELAAMIDNYAQPGCEPTPLLERIAELARHEGAGPARLILALRKHALLRADQLERRHRVERFEAAKLRNASKESTAQTTGEIATGSKEKRQRELDMLMLRLRLRREQATRLDAFKIALLRAFEPLRHPAALDALTRIVADRRHPAAKRDEALLPAILELLGARRYRPAVETMLDRFRKEPNRETKAALRSALLAMLAS